MWLAELALWTEKKTQKKKPPKKNPPKTKTPEPCKKRKAVVGKFTFLQGCGPSCVQPWAVPSGPIPTSHISPSPALRERGEICFHLRMLLFMAGEALPSELLLPLQIGISKEDEQVLASQALLNSAAVWISVLFSDFLAVAHKSPALATCLSDFG